MASYLLVETKGPSDGGDYAFSLGRQLRELAHEVTIYLLQDGVFSARPTYKAGAELVRDAERAGVRLLADVVSLRQRGVVGDRVAKGVTVAGMEQLVDLLMERSDKAIWH
ncbi:MAG: DsrE family protein [Candidatus Rokubacteria bacterium]|nr:DsrE family protein [Candidatus Rokubacteria bacterium]